MMSRRLRSLVGQAGGQGREGVHQDQQRQQEHMRKRCRQGGVQQGGKKIWNSFVMFVVRDMDTTMEMEKSAPEIGDNNGRPL